MKLFVTLGKEWRVCEYGDRHSVTLYTEKFVTDTGKTHVHDNGYEKRVHKIYVDYQGREWKCRNSIDHTYYTCDELKLYAEGRKPYNGIHI